MKLAKLEKVQLRNVWKHEALDFTNWLAEHENLTLLGDEIDIDISLIETEASVGKFSVDILAEEENTGKKIVIENQLEMTDHDHLGKIITYASGFDAEIIIWIVKSVREEHKQAIDWLNEHTDEKANFFAVKMEVWQIDNSPYAPKFHVVSQPNDWAKAVKKSSGKKSSLTKLNLLQLEFWESFQDYAIHTETILKIKKPSRPQHYLPINFGSSDSHFTLTVRSRKNLLGCELYIPDSKELFDKLERAKESIEQELKTELHWDNDLPRSSKASRIEITRNGHIKETDNWNDYFTWFLETIESFNRVFPKYINKKSKII